MEGLDFIVSAQARKVPPQWRGIRVREGLAPFRKAWWLHTRYESNATLRRYAHLLDWALGENGARPRGEALPPNARMLVFRFGHLGDMLHLLPVVAAIRQQRSDLRVELITGPWNKALASQFDRFDAVHYFTPDVVQFHRGQRDAVVAPDEERDWIRRVRGDGVDTVFAPAIPHFCELPIMVGVKASCYVGFDWPIDELSVEGEKRFLSFDSRRYELDAVADFLPLLGLEREPLCLRYRVPEASAARTWELLREAGLAGRPFIAAFPGSGWPGKCWPAARFSEALDAVTCATGVAVVLGGSAGERALCGAVQSGMKQAAINTAGLLTVDESAALIERSAIVLCNDSAPLHMAAALNRPTVSLWGPTFPEKWAPPGPLHRVIRRSGACAGCVYWHPAAACEKSPGCIESIPVESVVSALRAALG